MEFHCPVPGCIYANGSKRFFSKNKFLKQHIVKVHNEKKFLCSKCQKGFSMEWWHKHHESTCGMEWWCPCSSKFNSRESLLQHAKRQGHTLPDHILGTKSKQSKTPKKPKENNTLVYILQPLILNPPHYQSNQKQTPGLRPIVPKPSIPITCTIPLPVDQGNKNSVVPLQATNSDAKNNTGTSGGMPDATSANAPPLKAMSISSYTQTTEDLFARPSKMRESRASQCYRRKSKLSSVHNESTETQTAESTMVKIKRKKTRRKSVGTHPPMTVWPDFQDMILSSTGTQTIPPCSNKVLCDSQTITDEELMNFVLDRNSQSQPPCSGLELLSAVISGEALPNLSSNNLPFISGEDNILSYPEMGQPSTSRADVSMDQDANETSQAQTEPINPTSDEIFEFGAKATQTSASELYDYNNLLANTETQTTDDFSMYDMEFLDTETQTPWEDFLNIDDHLLEETNQLSSIEIQTDFSDAQSCVFPQFTNSESQTLDITSLMYPIFNGS